MTTRSGDPSAGCSHRYLKRIFAVLVLLLKISLLSAQDHSSLYGTRGIVPEAVRQGSLGSCYFHASISALAKTYPDVLRNAIKDDAMGGMSVSFESGPSEMVFQEDVDFGRQHGFDLSDGDWVLVLARGYAQRTLRNDLITAVRTSPNLPMLTKPYAISILNRSGLLILAYDRAIRSIVHQDGTIGQEALQAELLASLKQLHLPDSVASAMTSLLSESGIFTALLDSVKRNGDLYGAYRAIGQGGIPEGVLNAFLGGASTYTVSTNDRLKQTLQAVYANQGVMVAWTDEKSTTADDSIRQSSWWVAPHAYTVLRYDPDSQTVHLRNPWGDHPGPNGEFDLPLSVFARSYAYYSSYSK